jgi:hypothetical protein
VIHTDELDTFCGGVLARALLLGAGVLGAAKDDERLPLTLVDGNDH